MFEDVTEFETHPCGRQTPLLGGGGGGTRIKSSSEANSSGHGPSDQTIQTSTPGTEKQTSHGPRNRQPGCRQGLQIFTDVGSEELDLHLDRVSQ